MNLFFQRCILSVADQGRPGGLGERHARRADQAGAGHALLRGLGMARLQGEAGHALHGHHAQQGEVGHAQLVGAGHALLLNEVSVILLYSLHVYVIVVFVPGRTRAPVWPSGGRPRPAGSPASGGCPVGGRRARTSVERGWCDIVVMHYMCMALLYLCQEGHAHQLGQVGAGHAQPAVPHLAGAGHAHLVDEVSAVQF